MFKLLFWQLGSQNGWGQHFVVNCTAAPIAYRALLNVLMSLTTLLSSIHSGATARLRVGAGKQKMMVNVTQP